eukprot:g1220.t1
MSNDSEVDEDFENESYDESDIDSELSEGSSDHEAGQDDGQLDDSSDNEVEDDVFELENGGQEDRATVLRDFLRLLVGPRLNDHPAAMDNTELVNSLKELHFFKSSQLERVLLMCPRGTFVPPEYARDAYSDSPIRVREMEFNISAPHMHATCLEALELQPGEKFLDVGSGCGYIAACAAHLVGTEGEVIGLEIKQQIIDFSVSNVQRLRDENPVYAEESCEVEFVLKNAFMPPFRNDYFDKIHVGGTCPEDRLMSLIHLLKPNNGKMTVPVGQELKLITRRLDDRPNQRVLSQVRFSELTVPSDSEIVLSTLQVELESKMIIKVPPSTLQKDTRLVQCLSTGHLDDGDFMEEIELAKNSIPESSSSSSSSVFKHRFSRSISSLFGFGVISKECNKKEQSTNQEDVCLDLVHFAEPDCALVGEKWTLSSHQAVLKARCEYFRARFDSNMQDSTAEELTVPSHFSQDSMALFLQYIYKDELPDQLTPQTVIDIVHVAGYYGVPRLVVLCEHLLAEELRVQHSSQQDSAPEFAVRLLTLADTNGLSLLQEAVVHYIVRNYDKVSQTEAYDELSKREVDLIMKESFAVHERFKGLLKELSENAEMSSQ